ncbi:MAG: HDIG domain-containing protein [Lachnospiraceae bacterium]|nr:HDIG domain-containing protein [Lachnospiraceae bacterium]
MPVGAEYIIEKLNKAGFEAYIVGGCVRDSILGKQPNDWDITTSATPYEVKDIFRRTVDTGIQHGTVTVLVEKHILQDRLAELTNTDNHLGLKDVEQPYAFEVTTYRVDGKYEDHRRPTEVTFTASLEEDLKRRDFTINAMAYNHDEGVVDVFGGITDLKNGIIRCVGKAEDRFNEDALRILRAVRFAAQLGFAIDEETRLAMKAQAKFLSDISAERIQVELTKLITSDHPHMLKEAYELGLTAIILPEFDDMMQTDQHNPNHLFTVGEHTLKVMENVPADMVLRYSALLHDVAKPRCKTTDSDGVDHFYGHPEKGEKMARAILRRLKLDNNTVSRTCNLVLYHDYFLTNMNQGKAFRKFLQKLGVDNFMDYTTIRQADVAGQSDYNLKEKIDAIEVMKNLYKTVIDENQCININDLAIGGKDLIELGMSPGKEMGKMLQFLLDRVLETPDLNQKEILIDIVKSRLK